MKRALVLAVAMTGLALPAAANAGAFQGVVIAKNAKRKAIVTASANGNVRTIRAPKSFGKIGLGALVAVRARQLPDGTFAAAATKQIRRVKRARVQATVVKRAGQKLYLSAGNSVFAFGLRSGAGAKLRPGDRVTASASFGKAQLFCDAVKPVGHDDELELEGIYLSTEEGVLRLAVHGRGLVKVSVPDGLGLPELKPGDEISLHAAVASDGTFTSSASTTRTRATDRPAETADSTCGTTSSPSAACSARFLPRRSAWRSTGIPSRCAARSRPR